MEGNRALREPSVALKVAPGVRQTRARSTLVREWLQQRQLLFNPFETEFSEGDSHLADYLVVTPGHLQRGESYIICGKQGDGKTAKRLRYQLELFERFAADRMLPVAVQANVQPMPAELMRALVRAAYVALVANFDVLNIAAQPDIIEHFAWAFDQFGQLEDWRLSVIDALNSLEITHALRPAHQLWHKSGVPSQGLQALAKTRSVAHRPSESISMADIDSFIELLTRIGTRRVMIMADDFDAIDDVALAATTAETLWDLRNRHELVAVQLYVPDHLLKNNIIEMGAAQLYPITWDRDALQQLVEKRLNAARCDGKYVSLDVLLDEPGALDSFVAVSNHSPRLLIQMIQSAMIKRVLADEERQEILAKETLAATGSYEKGLDPTPPQARAPNYSHRTHGNQNIYQTVPAKPGPSDQLAGKEIIDAARRMHIRQRT